MNTKTILRLSRMLARTLLVCGLSLAAQPWASRADTATFTPTADASTYSDLPEINAGSANAMGIRQSALNGVTWAYLQFDLQNSPGPIPPGSVVISADLQLYLDNSAGLSPFAVQLCSVNESWSENSITWSSRPLPGTPFTTTGIQPTNAYVTWNATTLVQQWVSGQRANQGLVLRAESTNEMYLGFWSRESVINPPLLVISFTPPQVPPTITTHPQSQTVTAGDLVAFSVGATGTAPLSYQWRRDGVAIGGATNSVYNIASAQTNHAGEYSALAINVAGQAVSSNAILNVLSKPLTSFRILATHVAPDGKLSVDYPSDAANYFILLRGTNALQINQPVGMKLGSSLVDSLADASPASSPKAGFYRLRQVPMTQPLDSDGDEIDDVLELQSTFLNPMDAKDGQLDNDGDGMSNAGEFRLHTDAQVPNPLIQAVLLTKTNFCVGEEVPVRVLLQDPLGRAGGLSAMINGIAGDVSFLHFGGEPGERLIHVVAATEDGFVQSQTFPVSMETNTCGGAKPFHRVRAMFNPYHPLTADFTIDNFTALGTAGQAAIWDFGDGNTATNQVPFISHFYGESMDGTKPYNSFVLTVKSLDGSLVTRKTVTVHDNYFFGKKRNIIQPRVVVTAPLQARGNYWVGRYTMQNLESDPLIFDSAIIEYEHADTNSPPTYVHVSPGAVLFRGGFDEKYFCQQCPTNQSSNYRKLLLSVQNLSEFPNKIALPGKNTHPGVVKLDTATVPGDAVTVGIHLQGTVQNHPELRVLSSIYFELRRRPELTQAVADADLMSFFEQLIARGMVTNPSEITQEDLYRLQQEHKIERSQSGWRILP